MKKIERSASIRTHGVHEPYRRRDWVRGGDFTNDAAPPVAPGPEDVRRINALANRIGRVMVRRLHHGKNPLNERVVRLSERLAGTLAREMGLSLDRVNVLRTIQESLGVFFNGPTQVHS